MELQQRLATAADARAELFDDRHEAAFRLFNGFYEGERDIAIDIYAKTAVIHSYAPPSQTSTDLIVAAQEFLLDRLPWLTAILLKSRKGVTDEAKRGVLIYGKKAADRIREHGVWYAVDLAMNRDASLYLDTRNLRNWAIDNLEGASVLNTFAYTGSFGVAAMAAGASRVEHGDLNKRFLNVAKTSYTLNGFPIKKGHFVTRDFYPHMTHLNRARSLFDCVFIDPPFFATTKKGKVDLAKNVTSLINKVRPLVKDGGRIVAINNALFFSGAEYMAALESLCVGGYVSVEEVVPVSADFTGYPETIVDKPITDPAPFNHSTKIAVLRINHTPKKAE